MEENDIPRPAPSETASSLYPGLDSPGPTDYINKSSDGNGFNTLFAKSAEALYICSMDGTLMDCNQAMADLLGYPKNTLIGMPFFCNKIFSENDLGCAMDSLAKNRQGKSTGPEEFTLQTKDRYPVFVEASAHPILMENQTVVLGIAKDITPQKNAQREREQFGAQFRQAQKMEAVGTLTAGIAHEFNNILSPIMILTELTLLDLPDDSPLRVNLEKVLDASIRARDLISQILTLSRQGEEEPYPLKIGPVIKEALKLLRASLPTTIKISHQIQTASDTVLADPTLIYQVLMNLFTNAHHAMGKAGGQLTVTLDEALLGLGDVPDYPDLKPGKYLRFTVGDTGCGMDGDTLFRIFDPYFTTRKNTQSSGMGLTVARDIIHSYSGAICVKSEPEKGAIFDVFLPKFEIETQKEDISIQSLPEGDECILLVDDDINLMNSLKKALEKLGYQVTGSCSSPDALDIFRSHPDSFDLVITDQTMPDLTGENLSKELIEIRPDIPIILCTGFSELIDMDKASGMGIREFIMKPIKFRSFANTIRNALDADV